MSTPNYGSPLSGTLTTTTKIVDVTAMQIPASIALNSTDGSRAIAFSIDGTTYYTVTATGTVTGQIYYFLNSPVKKIKFTGVANDTYVII